MSNLSHDVERLRNIKTLPQIITYFRDELGWQIETTDIEEITFEYEPAELGFNNEEVVYFKESKQIRPLVADQPWGIFWISFEKKRLPVVILRRILAHLAIKKRQTGRRGDRPAWNLHDLLFIVAYGEENDRAITLAHFWQDPQNPGNLAELKVLGWDGGDTVLHLADAHKMLTEKLRWPEDTGNINSWREQWASAFTLGHKEVIATTQELEVELARLAIAIRKRANAILAKESERGPLRNLFSVFKKTLIHDLTLEDFADVIAQTISYGLLAARLTSSSMISVQNLVEMMPATNPFLRDLLSSFLSVTGRGGNFDFDELGVQEVVELLNRANVDAVKRDFGNRTRDEDPVIHFYEHFLKAYDPEKKVKRGVFFTPQPIVSYIVRSVHELLQTEFGLDDGLASSITWGEMTERNKDLKIPKDTKPEDHFVTILDPATGTATFLVEVIDVIYRFLKEKWKKQGIPEVQQPSIWNDYVSKHLLPRLFGYELMMAPYVIAHLKIGIKLAETGYKFDSDERARIYLTNALEPPIEQTRMENIIPALAREAKEVNEIKQKQRFTVVIGNPPYSIQSANLTDEARALVEPYKWIDGEHIRERNALQFEKNIQDDYVKFIRIAEYELEKSNCGIFGIICNNSFLDGRSFRGLRRHLLLSMTTFSILDLHGSGKKNEASGASGEHDENVFDIQQGVSITLARRNKKAKSIRVEHSDIFGERCLKSAFLLEKTLGTSGLIEINPKPPFYLLVPTIEASSPEFDEAMSLRDLFKRFSSGVKTHRDAFAYTFTRSDMEARISSFKDPKVSIQELREKFELKDGPLWQLERARKALVKDPNGLEIIQADYRPFDKRWLAYSDSIVRYTARPTMRHMLGGQNLALLVCQSQVERGFRHALVTRTVADCCSVSGRSRETTSLFPAFILNVGDMLFPGEGHDRVANLSEKGASIFSQIGGTRVPSPDLVLTYVYSLLYSPTYRQRYADSLRNDFPRVLIPASTYLFKAMSIIGSELIALHLMESLKLNHFITTYIGPKSPYVERVGWLDNTVWIDASATKKGQPATPGAIGFRGVPEEVWNFHIGGYKVCEKWLKDRKGRTLSKDDIVHYQKIVVALNETIRLMKEIDEVIEHHGGWPGAFI